MKKLIIPLALLMIIGLSANAQTKNKSNQSTKMETQENKQIDLPDENTTIFINAGDHKIPAIVTLPKEAFNDNKVPAVIMLHATGADKNGAGDGFKNIAPKLAAAGIACIRIDFMGSGESTEDYAKYSYTTAIIDVDTTADYLVSLGIIDPKRIGLLGWSQGGTDALLAAANNDRYASVVTWAGSINLGYLITDKMREDAQKQGYATLNLSFGGSERLGKQWIDEVDATNVLEKVAATKAPICAIAGTKDAIVPPQAATDIINASTNKKSKRYNRKRRPHI